MPISDDSVPARCCLLHFPVQTDFPSAPLGTAVCRHPLNPPPRARKGMLHGFHLSHSALPRPFRTTSKPPSTLCIASSSTPFFFWYPITYLELLGPCILLETHSPQFVLHQYLVVHTWHQVRSVADDCLCALLLCYYCTVPFSNHPPPPLSDGRSTSHRILPNHMRSR